jgi:hypothetical protein
MADIWSLTRPEFYDVFERMRHLVNFEDATTPQEIDKRMLVSVWVSKRQAESISKLEELRKTLRRELGEKASEFQKQIRRLKTGINRALAARNRRNAEQIDKLINAGFSGRVIAEGNIAPNGIIGLTLRYGNVEANRRIHATQRARVRAGRAGLKKRTPEFRAGLRELR